MAFGRKVDYRPRAVSTKNLLEKLEVCYVTLNKNMTRIAIKFPKIVIISCVGQLVDIHYALVRRRKPIQHEIASDEPRPTRH
jgi:hypothetical protein